MATSSSGRNYGGSSSSREGSAKTMAADQITQAVQSSSNLLQLMLQSSPSQAQLVNLPKNLLAKASTIKNTELALQQMPRLISALDAHMENGLQSVPHLKTVIQLMSNIESCQLKSLSKVQLTQEETESIKQPPESG
ncbi:hypothetical protein M9H77_33055 [Catharanthus roseus]|uniref:Uncharacterized protein n=1 Tax=Catharanthus roseus TaxID=4058 RepID=A0ACC0A8W2_CATRO|nr:hypothetical protein M9H77_33055 [Catharanthus roseus]